MSDDKLNEAADGALSRRGLAKAAAWGAPAVVMMGAAPCATVSNSDIYALRWFYVDQRDTGSHSSNHRGNFHYLFPKDGSSVTVPAMRWTVRVIPVPNNDNLVQVDQDRDVWIEGYNGTVDSAVPFTGTTGPAADGFLSATKVKAQKGADGSYTLTFTTKEVTDTRGNQIRSYGFKVFTGRAAASSGRADKVVIEGKPVDASTAPPSPFCAPPGSGGGNADLWVKYDTIKAASPDKRWTVGLSEAENRRRGWSQQQDGRV